jgi:hypothetical protein
MWTLWVLHMTSPVGWLENDIGIPAKIFGFLFWILLSRVLAIQIALRTAAFGGKTSLSSLMPPKPRSE